jgi:hypothetical protein
MDSGLQCPAFLGGPPIQVGSLRANRGRRCLTSMNEPLSYSLGREFVIPRFTMATGEYYWDYTHVGRLRVYFAVICFRRYRPRN